MTTEELLSRSRQCLMNTYARQPLVLVRGEGVTVWDSDGTEYLDFLAGVAVCALGHSHPKVVDAICAQAGKLMHVSNIFHIEPQIRMAELLVAHSFADRVFFCNSGAEANEAAIKLARKYTHETLSSPAYEIITMEQSFHGRTLATIAATGQQKFHRGFEPLVPGFRYVPFDDVRVLADAITGNTCAVMVEPIQGEGGVQVPSADYLRKVRELCNDRGILLILDEVQTGMGRTGDLFAYERAGITPDIMTLAKGLGNGFPVGAMLATERVASAFVPGSHATTFGGNPLAMAAALAVFETMRDDGILEHCRRMGSYFMGRLDEVKSHCPVIREVRGRGLLIGVELSIEGTKFVGEFLKRGILMNCTAGNVLRFVPPLIVTKEQIDRVTGVLEEVLAHP